MVDKLENQPQVQVRQSDIFCFGIHAYVVLALIYQHLSDIVPKLKYLIR